MLPGRLASWLFGPIAVEAKEGFEVGRGVAVDPKGEWVAALGVDDNADWQGVWVFDAKSGRLLRHVVTSSGSAHFRGLAVSLDGSALYALEVASRQVAIDVIDPNTGRVRSIADARLAGSMGIAGVAQAP
jgi:DNA-binding beta-propeller fold protein YncE